MTKSDDLLATRKTALRIVSKVTCQKISLDKAFADELKTSFFDKKDEGFVRLLVLTFLRHLGEIDDFLSSFLKKPLPKKEEYVQNVLRLGVVQSVFLKTPDHAVVSTSVSLLKKYKKGVFAGLGNAVLRKVVQNTGKMVKAPEKNFPQWLSDLWRKSFGFEKTKRIQTAFLKESFIDVSVKKNPDFWAEKLFGTIMPTGVVRCSNDGTVFQKEGYEEGEWWIQDFSASLPVKLLGNVSNAKILDICAAPGGKTAQLCAGGAKVTALDISEKRLKRFHENMRRLSFNPEVVCADFETWQDNRLFDAIVLDAPCSAVGTIRKHPDILFHRTLEDVVRLSEMQEKFLKKAFQKVVRGGLLIYCVCSILPQEGETIVESFLQKNDIIRIPVTEEEIPKECLSEKGDVLCLPYHMESFGGCDGFYVARLKKG